MFNCISQKIRDNMVSLVLIDHNCRILVFLALFKENRDSFVDGPNLELFDDDRDQIIDFCWNFLGLQTFIRDVVENPDVVVHL